MLLACGNMFSSKITFCYEGAGIPALQKLVFYGKVSIKAVPINFEIFPGRCSQASLQLRPWLPSAGIARLVQGAEEPACIPKPCIFLLHLQGSYMSPYFSVSHTFLSLTLTVEVSYLCQKYLPAPLNKCHLMFHHWLKLARVSKMAFVMGSLSYVLQDLSEQPVLVPASTGGGIAFAPNPRSLFRIWVLRVSRGSA